MRKVVVALAFLWSATVHGAIYDCFMFFNEIELLKLRLEELDEAVDYFVLVESIETQRGNVKPLYFQQNRHLFEKYLHKIIHVVIDERHPEMGLWERENYQRNAIGRGLVGCDYSDLILISDLDEIPRPHLIASVNEYLPERNKKMLENGRNRKYKKHNKNKKSASKEEKMFYFNGSRAFEQTIYFFQLNRQTTTGETWGGGPWAGTVATTYGLLRKFGAQHFRDYRWKFRRILNGGWHFTWMGGKDRIRAKMGSIVEGHENAISEEEIDRWINQHPVVPIDETFPLYVQRNFDYLKSMGYIANYN